ncbi:MAG: hypothetical protein A2498_08100 [Lentisphaerae bacterium RIFOXYC12_FULL_60_16]|nr:MAG: hypothetical protein A2498_08100 [Lentisphaerae bacterium RIFOXYC12_FULL_60_16]OGV72617.1 MAG: hypothetical protein A2269_02030 [Lentisphaerae bacterium RIFOXYA12_FULL_60_10]OGV84746.1 MAG: hypothetical protein A2340_04285 [Lentisphaerae bacterium RIFOXYB12_FULL_60_10]
MSQIPVIIPGTLSPRKDSKGKINGWKLQRWHNGHNQTRYVPGEQVEIVRQGTDGCQQFMALAEQYVECKGQEALKTLATPADGKKKPMKR